MLLLIGFTNQTRCIHLPVTLLRRFWFEKHTGTPPYTSVLWPSCPNRRAILSRYMLCLDVHMG